MILGVALRVLSLIGRFRVRARNGRHAALLGTVAARLRRAVGDRCARAVGAFRGPGARDEHEGWEEGAPHLHRVAVLEIIASCSRSMRPQALPADRQERRPSWASWHLHALHADDHAGRWCIRAGGRGAHRQPRDVERCCLPVCTTSRSRTEAGRHAKRRADKREAKRYSSDTP